MAKIGDRFVDDMIDRGRREIGGFFYQDSNIAQPMYPLRGGYEVSKEASKDGPSLGDRLKQTEVGRDDHGREEPEMERE